LSRTFGYRLLNERVAPRWLRPIPFRPRFPNPGGDNRAALFEVVTPEQTDFEAAWNMAVAEVADGSSVESGGDFRRAISLAAPARSSELYQNAGRIAYQWGDHGLAVRLLDSAMSRHPSRAVAANIAWILATSRDDRVRNGRAALESAERLVREDPADQTSLDVFAAALAEMGRYADAVAVAQRMLSSAQASGNAAGEARAKERLAAYGAGRPWRQ
jgi:tetratricopeptide (TPR) repeat protein